jgi:hypothetical protein
MDRYPEAVFDVATFVVSDEIKSSDLISIQENYIRPILTENLYDDFLKRMDAPEYEQLKSFVVECCKQWLFYLSFDKKIIFKNFMENSAESPYLHRSTKQSALAQAQASSNALRSHVITSNYPLYTPDEKKRIAGILIKKTTPKPLPENV